MFYRFIVEEWKTLYADGMPVTLPDGREINVRAALFFVACDIPASRKVCGFTAVE